MEKEQLVIDSLVDTKRIQAYVYCDYYAGGRMAMELIMDEDFSISTKKDNEIAYPVKLTARETARKKGS